MFGLCESATERLDESFLGIAYSTRRLVLVLVFDDRPVSEAEDKGNRKGVFVVNCRICPTTDVVELWLLIVWLWRGFIAMAGSFVVYREGSSPVLSLAGCGLAIG